MPAGQAGQQPDGRRAPTRPDLDLVGVCTATGASLHRRGFAYSPALTAVVVTTGAALRRKLAALRSEIRASSGLPPEA